MYSLTCKPGKDNVDGGKNGKRGGYGFCLEICRGVCYTLLLSIESRVGGTANRQNRQNRRFEDLAQTFYLLLNNLTQFVKGRVDGMTSNTDQTPDVDELIELAKRNLIELGIEGASVSHHGTIVRIQVSESDFNRAIQMRQSIVDRLKAIGYRYVALDLNEK